MSRKATKFYVRRPDGTEFITTADAPHHAVVLLWRHQLKAAIESGRSIDSSTVPLHRAYNVHTGREAEAETVSAGTAYWSAHPAIAAAVGALLCEQHGEEECDRLLWAGSADVPLGVRHMTRDQLREV